MEVNKFQCCLLAWVSLITIYDIINGHEIILQKAEVIKYNENFVRNITVQVVQYTRRRKPVVNIAATTLHTWDNNVTIDMIYEEFIRNEYKPSFVGIRFKLCEMIESPYFNIRKIYGYVCPLLPGEKNLANLTVNLEQFPNVFPFNKGRVIVSYDVKPVGMNHSVNIVTAHVYVAFKEH